MTDNNTTITKEDQLVASLAHAGVLVPTFGLLVPLIIWITQKERSSYLQKQALQATIWQLIALLVQFMAGACYFLSFFLLIPVGMIAESEQFSGNPASGGAMAALIFMVFILAILVFLIGGLAHFGFGIGGAVQMLRGKDFNYPFIGRWVVNRLEADKKIEESKEHIEDEEN